MSARSECPPRLPSLLLGGRDNSVVPVAKRREARGRRRAASRDRGPAAPSCGFAAGTTELSRPPAGADRAGGLSGNDLLRIVKRRLKGAGLPPDAFCCHSFRATTATNLLKQRVPRDQVQYLLGHSDARTTDLYDRTEREVTRNIVERISIESRDPLRYSIDTGIRPASNASSGRPARSRTTRSTLIWEVPVETSGDVK